MKKAKHFKLEELVCPHVLKRDGQRAWRYVQPVVIDFLDWLRERVGVPVVVNTYAFDGDLEERGVRCNLCSTVKSKTQDGVLYMSAHKAGLAIDINAEGMTSNELREWLMKHISEFFYLFPQYIAECRIESSHYAPTWCHIDFYQTSTGEMIQIVKPL